MSICSKMTNNSKIIMIEIGMVAVSLAVRYCYLHPLECLFKSRLLFPNVLPANSPGKAVADPPNTWFLPPTRKTQLEFLASAFHLAEPQL